MEPPVVDGALANAGGYSNALFVKRGVRRPWLPSIKDKLTES